MTPQVSLVSVNGYLGAEVPNRDRGLAYGDGLFETIRVLGGRLPLWPLHLERLLSGASRLSIPFDPDRLERFRDQLLKAASEQTISDGVLKIILTRGTGGRGYQWPADASPNLCLFFDALPASLESDSPERVTVRLCQQRLSANRDLAGLKHLNRLEQVLARGEWESHEVAEGLMMDQNGWLIEGTSNNFFLVRDGTLYTPDLTWSGVAGVARRLIMENLAPALDLAVEVSSLSPSLLDTADELFICNSVRGIRPVTAIVDHQADLDVGPITLSLWGAMRTVMNEGVIKRW